MLTTETKRHIDNARQILVGAVPNPTSQIEQITYALIYKFMDDMDESAIKVGGEASFFIEELERYSWRKLMDSRKGNQERMNLYTEAFIKFAESKHIPGLFRDILKSAYLPYRSPEVLGLFLQEINYFDYTHPEELGNAYEYLLSVMGSQGDAGQFRTPRHIIDFIVRVVDPTKNDRILDPASGTAGFLISAYKHVLEQHDGHNSRDDKVETPLTPDERKSLMDHFEGYDIDPGMVRIAQVNMFLHNFRNPKIYNYDSLSSEERWKDKFDIIIANPPFMTPHGGIRPHNKFSIRSSRSEVLFVNYIINHLLPKGRAGIIVPEGIIENDGKDFIALRKQLIEAGLYAIVSLPIGTFNPYSNTIKTSILFIDDKIKKLGDNILIYHVDHDGFDLGRNRNAITANDLPLALAEIKEFHHNILAGINALSKSEKKLFLEKNKILESPIVAFNERNYLPLSSHSKYDFIEVDKIFNIEKGTLQSTKNISGEYNFITASGEWKNHNSYTHDCEAIVFAIGASGSLARSHYVKGKFIASDLCLILTVKEGEDKRLDIKYYYNLFTVMRPQLIEHLARGAAKKAINQRNFKKYLIPRPSYEDQVLLRNKTDDFHKEIMQEQKIIKISTEKINSLKKRIEETLIS